MILNKRFFIRWLALILYISGLNRGYSQNQNTPIKYHSTGLTLLQILDTLEEHYGIKFSYSSNSLENMILDIDIKASDLSSAMDQLLEAESLEYHILDDNVLIRKKEGYTTSPTPSYNKSLHLRGQITADGEPISYATIAVAGTAIGTYSSESGYFDIEIPTEYQNNVIVIQHLGYEEESILLLKEEDDFINIALTESNLSIDEIIIVNREKPVQILTRENHLTMNATQLQSNAGSLIGTDVNRQLQSMAGVSAVDDTSADIKVRGSNGDETMMILDGMPIYQVDHYYGIFGVFNGDYIKDAQLYKNYFPLQYGGKTAGIVHLTSGDNILTTPKVSAQLNLLNAAVDAVFPISDKWQLQLATRSTIRDISNSQFNTFAGESMTDRLVENFSKLNFNAIGDPQFSFGDLNAKLLYKPSDSEKLELNFFASQDDLSNNTAQRLNNRRADVLSVNSTELEEWNNIAASINYHRTLGDNIKWTTNGYFTTYKNDASIDISTESRLEGRESSTTITNSNSTEVENISLNSYVELPLKNGTIAAGISSIHHDISYHISEQEEYIIRGDNNLWENSLSVELDQNLTKKLQLQLTARATHYSLTEQIYISPRALLQYSITDQLRLKSSYSIYQQFVREFEYEYRAQAKDIWVFGGENDIPILASNNLMLGASYGHDLFGIDIELYRKTMTGVTEYAVSRPRDGNNQGARDYNLFAGDGLYQGIDITISTGYQKYDTYLSYSLSSFEQRYDEIDRGNYLPTENDRRHQLKWINSYTWDNWKLEANFIYSSGRPYTDITRFTNDRDIRDTGRNQRFRYLPAYARVDIGISRQFNIGKTAVDLSASVFNLFNRQNVKYIQSVSQTIQRNNSTPINTIVGNETTLLGRTLNLSATFRLGGE